MRGTVGRPWRLAAPGLAVGPAFGAVTGGVGPVLAALALGVVHRVRGL